VLFLAEVDFASPESRFAINLTAIFGSFGNRNRMRLLLPWILLLLLGWLLQLGWQLHRAGSGQPQAVTNTELTQTPCQWPLAWRLGELDPAFQLSRQDAIFYIEQASQQWQQASGKMLFVQDQQRGFAIDFRFDARQQQLLQQQLLQRNLQRYDQAITPGLQQLPVRASLLQQQLDEFNQQQQQLQHQIKQWQPQQADAAARRQQLLQQQQQLTQQADWLEQQRLQLQRDQDYLNETIRQRNELLPADRHQRTGSFAVGSMATQGQQRQMTIFAFASAQQLVSTLVHEFGHAIGIGHTTAPASMMYPSQQPEQQRLTATDLAALTALCGER
jgi:tetratricopeptide (TPR) repeat protein